jgi:hypothetical protein
MRRRLLALAVAVLLSVAKSQGAQDAREDDSEAVRQLLERIATAVLAGDAAGYAELLSTTADVRRAAAFAASEFGSAATRAVVLERDRVTSSAGGFYRLVVDAFIERGHRARVATWQIDIARLGGGSVRIANQERLSSLEGLYRLALDETRQYRATDFRIRAEDLELTLQEGSVFTVNADDRVTGLVLMGRGEMLFRPSPAEERAQVRFFSGAETLRTRFDAAFLRLGEAARHTDLSTLVAEPVDSDDLGRASRIFREESPKSFVVDLADLTADRWSGTPPPGDFLAEVRTRQFRTLTYSFAASEPEDVTLFTRGLGRTIAVYASRAKIQERGPFFNEDDVAQYDVLDYDVDLTYSPADSWIDAIARMRMRILSPSAGQLRLSLADPLAIRSIVSQRFGRLFALRAAGQNSVLVNWPSAMVSGTDDTLTIAYSGRLEPQPTDRESLEIAPVEQAGPGAGAFPVAEPTYLYSNRNAWYPQAPIGDYATATLSISVPLPYGCVASGTPDGGSPTAVLRDGFPPRRQYTFTAVRPLRYLSFLVSRFSDVDTGGEIAVHASPRQTSRVPGLAAQAARISRFYQDLLDDLPYPSFALALVESDLPGGHSPAYFAILNMPIPGSSLSWRDDPVAFDRFPEFFLAHEIAHQWWGQAVGWGNYHEQWLSEGFAQYFAAMYAQQARGDEAFADVLRSMKRWSIERSHAGPVYLGSRVGHVSNDARSFRAIVYNKGAVVLHMLRQLVGDEAFFSGLRRYYDGWRFRKASTEDFRTTMETAAGRPLDRFFRRWVYESDLPRLSFSYRVETTPEGQRAAIRFEQAGESFDVPVTLTIQYANRRTTEVIVPVTAAVVDHVLALDGPVRSIGVSRNDLSLAEISRR